jgi:hypothetical protein
MPTLTLFVCVPATADSSKRPMEISAFSSSSSSSSILPPSKKTKRSKSGVGSENPNNTGSWVHSSPTDHGVTTRVPVATAQLREEAPQRGDAVDLRSSSHPLAEYSGTAPDIQDLLSRFGARADPSPFSSLTGTNVGRNVYGEVASMGHVGGGLDGMILNSLYQYSMQQQQEQLLQLQGGRGGFCDNSGLTHAPSSTMDESKLDHATVTSLFSSLATSRLSDGPHRQLMELNPTVLGYNRGQPAFPNHSTTNEHLIQELVAQARNDNTNLLGAAMNLTPNIHSLNPSAHQLSHLGLSTNMGSDPHRNIQSLLSTLAAQSNSSSALAGLTHPQLAAIASGNYQQQLTNSLLQQQLLLQQRLNAPNIPSAMGSSNGNFFHTTGRPDDTSALAMAMAQMASNPSSLFATAPSELRRDTSAGTASLSPRKEGLSSQPSSYTSAAAASISREDLNTTLTAVVPMDSPDDVDHLSTYQCLIRGQIQFFAATAKDASVSVQGRKKRVRIGQVGIQCRHCAHLPHRLRNRGAIYYPTHLSGVYQVVQNMSILHLIQSCQEIPAEIRAELQRVRGNRLDSAAGSGRKYWIIKFTELGLVEYDGGLFFRKT